VSYRRRAAPGEVSLDWQPPGGTRALIPSEALRTTAGRRGLDVRYQQPILRTSGVGRDAGRAALRALAVRYVVLSERRNPCVEDELDLPLVYSGEDVRIFEVPAK
jgi:hypothetical protein